MRIKWLAAAVLLVLSLPAAAGDEPHPAARGGVAGPIAKLLADDPAEHAAAADALRARGSFALPYVLSAAESTADDAARDRLLALAREIRAGLPDPDPLGTPPGGDEFPEWDITALNEWNRVRARLARANLRIDAPPGSVAAVRIAIEEEQWAFALEFLGQLVRTRPEHIEEALRLAAHNSFHGRDEVAALVAELDAAAAEKEAAAPREQAGRLAWLRARWWRDDRRERLEAVAEEYGDEPAGLLARRDLLAEYGENAAAEVRDLMAFADAHPGTEAARLALEEAVFQYHFNLTKKGEDQAARLRTTADLAARLMSDEFPGPGGCAAAVRNLAEFYLRSEPIPADSAREMLGFYRAFFRHHFLLDSFDRPATPIGYYLLSKLGRLHQALGVPEADLPQVLDAELAALEEALPAKAAIRYLRACEWAKHGKEEQALAAFAAIEKVFPGRLYARRALAARATLRYARGEFGRAEELYRSYVALHPESPYAWLAALRTAWSLARRGELVASERECVAVRERFRAHPLAPGLAALGAARIAEEDDRPADAARWYGEALDDVGTQVQGLTRRAGAAFDPEAPLSSAGRQARLELFERFGRTSPALVAYLRGERLRRDGKDEEAAEVWRGILREEPDEPVVRAALVNLLLDRALAGADAGTRETRLAELTALDDPFGALAADLVRALVELSKKDGRDRAAERLGAALTRYVGAQTLREPAGDLESDVAAIRAACFRPHENTFFRGEWVPDRTWPFQVVNPAIPVESPDGREQVVTLRQRLPDLQGALYLDADRLHAVGRILEAFGGGRRTKSANFMAIPRPEGGAEAIRALLDRFLMVVPGHWGGWELETFPRLDRIVFGEARATAVVQFKVRYEGGEAKLAKVDGKWELGEVEITWIE